MAHPTVGLIRSRHSWAFSTSVCSSRKVGTKGTLPILCHSTLCHLLAPSLVFCVLVWPPPLLCPCDSYSWCLSCSRPQSIPPAGLVGEWRGRAEGSTNPWRGQVQPHHTHPPTHEGASVRPFPQLLFSQHLRGSRHHSQRRGRPASSRRALHPSAVACKLWSELGEGEA